MVINMWFLFAILSGFFFASLNLIERHLLESDESDPLAFSFFFSFLSMLLLIPFVLFDPQFSSEFLPWLLVIIVSALLSANNFLNFTGIKYASASIVGTIGKFKIVWVFVLGLLLAQEVWSPYKGLGIFLTVLAGVVLVAKLNMGASLKGIIFAFVSTFFGAMALVIYTPLLKEFNVTTLTFLIFAFPAGINFIAMKGRIFRVQRQYNAYSWRLLIVSVFGVLGNIFIVAAINLGEASRVLVVVEFLFILVLLGEHYVLKDKTQVLRKGIAATFATIGAILMRIVP